VENKVLVLLLPCDCAFCCSANGVDLLARCEQKLSFLFTFYSHRHPD
jgi:hypothetical protein